MLKPTDSAGSDGVKLCHNLEEAREHFHHLFEVEAVNGGMNEEVSCVTCLGKEMLTKSLLAEILLNRFLFPLNPTRSCAKNSSAARSTSSTRSRGTASTRR